MSRDQGNAEPRRPAPTSAVYPIFLPVSSGAKTGHGEQLHSFRREINADKYFRKTGSHYYDECLVWFTLVLRLMQPVRSGHVGEWLDHPNDLIGGTTSH